MKTTLGYTKELLASLNGVEFEIDSKKVKILDDLKSMPRSGKFLRINEYNLPIPVQSIYDHLLQLAVSYDVLAEELDLLIIGKKQMAELIASHDLTELIIGDIPDYTNKGKQFKGVDGNIKVQNKVAQAIITNALSSPLKDKYKQALSLISQTETELSKTFFFIDKSEPIIAVWMYIHLFRDKIDINVFLKAMTDFFVNPVEKKYSINDKTKEFINFFQNKENAKKYFDNNLDTDKLSFNFKKLIESREMEFVKQARNKPS